MKNSIKFSIIMPFYNSSPYIENAVKSVLNQSYDNWELIAVNDGSSDNSRDIVTNLAKKYSKQVKILDKENGGYTSAVNFGLDNISGDYFMFMGSDDQLDKEILNNVVNNIEDELPDLIGFNTLKVWLDKQQIEECTKIEKKVFSSNTDIVDFSNDYKNESRIFSRRDTSKIYKSKILRGLRYFGKNGYDADGIFSMLFARKCSSFLCLPIIGYYWTIREDSLSGIKPSEKVNIERIKNWLLFYSSIKNINKFSLYEIYYCNYVIEIMIEAAEQGNQLLKYNYVCFKELSKFLLLFDKTNHFLSKKRKLFLHHPKIYFFLRRFKH